MNHAWHASCVAWRGRGVLIVGASGSGKSTLAHTLCQHGWMLVADDAVLVDAGPLDTGLHARGLPRSGGWLAVGTGPALRLAYRHAALLCLVVRLGGAGDAPPGLPVADLAAGLPAQLAGTWHHLIHTALPLP